METKIENKFICPFCKSSYIVSENKVCKCMECHNIWQKNEETSNTKNTTRLLLICRTCGTSEWIKPTEETDMMYKCTKCGELAYPEDMDEKEID